MTPARSVGSVHAYVDSPDRVRSVSMRVRSSLKWTALTGVTPGTSGSSVNPLTPPTACTVTAIDCVALKPAGSRAVTVTVAVPAATGASVTVLPETAAVTTPVRLERAA